MSAKNLPFGIRRRPGRPRLAPLAFIRATNFTSLLDIEDEAEHEDDVRYENVDINENENENIAANIGCSVTEPFSSENDPTIIQKVKLLDFERSYFNFLE